MTLKAILDSLEGLSQEIASQYVSGEDGKYVLSVEGVDGYELKDVAKLQSALQSERKRGDQERRNRIEAENKLEAFSGMDPAVARDAIAKLEEMKNWSPEDKVRTQIESAREEISGQFAEKLAAAERERDEAVSKLRNNTIRDVAMQAISKSEGVAKLLLPHVVNAIILEETESGELVPRIRGEGGTPAFSAAKPHEYMGVEEYVLSLKDDDDFAYAFKGNGARGSGASSAGSGRSGTANPFAKETLNLTEQVRMAKENPVRAAQLKAAANNS